MRIRCGKVPHQASSTSVVLKMQDQSPHLRFQPLRVTRYRQTQLSWQTDLLHHRSQEGDPSYRLLETLAGRDADAPYGHCFVDQPMARLLKPMDHSPTLMMGSTWGWTEDPVATYAIVWSQGGESGLWSSAIQPTYDTFAPRAVRSLFLGISRPNPDLEIICSLSMQLEAGC